MSKHNGNPEGERFTRLEGAEYDRVNDFIREHTYLTAREWAILRASQDLRTKTGVPSKRVGEELPSIAPFIDEELSRQNVHNARSRAYEKTVRAGATFIYATMTGAFDGDDVDDIMYDATEKAKLLLEAEGVDLSIDEELAAEQELGAVLQEIREASREVRASE